MIRFLVILIFVVIFLIVSLPIFLIEWILGKFNKHAADISSLRIVQWAFKVIIFLSGVRPVIIGEENVPKDQPVLYIPNHQSIFDIVLTYPRCPGLTGYVSKDSMAKVPLLSTWMRRIYCLFLNRSDVKEGLKMILTGIEQIKNGVSMCIFPEGTRNKTPEKGLLPFHEGSMKMAEKTGCPIIPVAISNTANIFENHFPRVTPCPVIIQYGEPILIKELDKEQRKFLGAYTQKKIQEMLTTHQTMM